MAEITLTASMRSNLLSLKNTSSLMATTQERLSTGLKVNSAIDNPSSYYTAQSLNNRANDLTSLMDSMTQGIQTVKAANEGIEAITSLVEQAKSIANSARDTTDMEERDKYARRFNEIRGQIDALAKDSGYKGINLVYNTGTQEDADTLKVRFNEYMGEGVSTFIEVKGVNLVSGSTAEDGTITYGLGLNEVDTADDTGATAWGSDSNAKAPEGGKFVVAPTGEAAATDGAVQGGTTYYTKEVDDDGNITYKAVSGQSILDTDADAEFDGGMYNGVEYFTLTKGADITDVSTVTTASYVEDANGNLTQVTTATLNSMKVNGGNDAIDASLQQVETAIGKLREVASDFGSAYSIIETRQDFTESLVNVLTEGADSLTLADMNEESANMLALQTRQQLAINALSLSSQANQAVLSLFG